MIDKLYITRYSVGDLAGEIAKIGRYPVTDADHSEWSRREPAKVALEAVRDFAPDKGWRLKQVSGRWIIQEVPTVSVHTVFTGLAKGLFNEVQRDEGLAGVSAPFLRFEFNGFETILLFIEEGGMTCRVMVHDMDDETSEWELNLDNNEYTRLV